MFLLRHLQPLGDVRLHHQRAHGRRELLVARARAGGLVLGVVLGLRQLADVVVVGRHARHERVGADRLGGPLAPDDRPDRHLLGGAERGEDFLLGRKQGDDGRTSLGIEPQAFRIAVEVGTQGFPVERILHDQFPDLKIVAHDLGAAGQVVDPLAQQRDLHFGRARIGWVEAITLH